MKKTTHTRFRETGLLALWCICVVLYGLSACEPTKPVTEPSNETPIAKDDGGVELASPEEPPTSTPDVTPEPRADASPQEPPAPRDDSPEPTADEPTIGPEPQPEPQPEPVVEEPRGMEPPNCPGADGGAGPDASAPDVGTPGAPTGTIQVSFSPTHGGTLPVLDGCVTVTFSEKPCLKERAALLTERSTSRTITTSFDFDPKDRKIAKICALGALKPGDVYTLEVSVKANVSSCETTSNSTAAAHFRALTTYSDEAPPLVGSATNLQYGSVKKPSGVGDLINGLNPDQIPPQLWSLAHRSACQQGRITLPTGRGTAPAGGKPHQGNDTLDGKDPYQLKTEGLFHGRWFRVTAPSYTLSMSGFFLKINKFVLSGIFSRDGKRIETARITGLLDPNEIQKRFGLDICALLAGECIKDANGNDIVPFGGTVKGTANPLPFSTFLVQPYNGQDGVATSTDVAFYFTQRVQAKDITWQWATCAGSTDPERPCDASKGAQVTAANITGQLKLDAAGTSGTYTPTGLASNTWYKVTLSAKTAGGQSFQTFAIFQTQ